MALEKDGNGKAPHRPLNEFTKRFPMTWFVAERDHSPAWLASVSAWELSVPGMVHPCVEKRVHVVWKYPYV